MKKRKRGTTRDMMVPVVASQPPLVTLPRCVQSPPCGHCWYCLTWAAKTGSDAG